MWKMNIVRGGRLSDAVCDCMPFSHWKLLVPRVACGPHEDTSVSFRRRADYVQFSRISTPSVTSSMLTTSILRDYRSNVSVFAYKALSPVGVIQKRFKNVLRQAYRRSRGSGKQTRKAHIGIKSLPSEHVRPGQLLVLQRRYIAHNPHVTRRRNFRYYPGENVRVDRKTSLYSTTWGRVKLTHDVTRNVLIINVLPEVREELLPRDLWRYRMEHVASMEENRNVCWLRTKAGTIFPKPLVNPPQKKPPNRYINKAVGPEPWENSALPDSQLYAMGYPLPR